MKLLALSILGLNGAALAQETPPTEHVNVIGQAASLDQALRKQRASDRIESVVHADGVAQLPDDNAAEALQRVPGVSVERDQGEGRFVSVRGLGPDFNSVTINGAEVPAPESDTRAVALDVLPSELIQSLSVVKTLTPDMDANSLGGTVEIDSLSAFDHEGRFYTFTAEGGYDGNTDKTSPKLSGAVSERFSLGGGTDNFGVAAAFSWNDRRFGSDNVETGGAWDFDEADGRGRLEELEARRYDITRERTGLGLNFDYRPDAASSYYLRTLYSRFADTEERQSVGLEFDDPLLAGESGDDAEAVRSLKQRKETQTVESYALGGERSLGAWTLSGQAAWSKASERLKNGIGAADFVRDIDGVGYTSGHKPYPLGGADFNDASQYELDEVEITDSDATDKIRSLRLDLARDFELGGHASRLKFGAKFSKRDKRFDEDVWVYDDFGGAALSLDQYARGSIDNLGGPRISNRAIRNLIATLDRDGAYDEEESRINDFRIREDRQAAYVMNTLDWHDWTFIAGLRYERDRLRAEGTGVRDGDFEASRHRRTDSHWLPGLHARYRIDRQTQVRAAWTQSVVRPTFGQLAPGFVIDGDEAEFGNPNLKPLKSRNLDLGIERYLGRSGVMSAHLFHKDIRDFAYGVDVAGQGEWAAFDEAHTFANGDDAKVYGLELAWSQKLDHLPAPWNGLILGTNLTFSRSDARIEGMADGAWHSRKIDLPNQADTVANVMLGWENRRASIRLSANYKSERLIEVAGIADPQHDLQADSQLFVDLSVRYFITPRLQLSFEAQNLTDENYYTYVHRRAYNSQYEEYGRAYKLGLTFTSDF
ncbi:TonB-dependent receptor [Pseudothauera rhizosphaerae]|uniref:TonB-dependent receptor n=1 Tax=Pseudothauera rhizosphaerae TaxID=2565932 RepID=A0A4S4AYZ3_9RHOO|nr:TonB-dependent receptor [Pseudothauera rhizosphaerae]THF65378.1 TonB-dependent receptor [Pseudothauera rhizosphaerae]